MQVYWTPKRQVRGKGGPDIKITMWMCNRLQPVEVKGATDLAQGFQCEG